MYQKSQNHYQLRDVEMVYEKVIRMISSLKEKYKLINRIPLNESDKAIFQELSKGSPQLIDLLKKGGDVHLIFQNNFPYFEVRLDQEYFRVEPNKMKQFFLKKQLRELGLKNIEFKSKECKEHKIEDDLYDMDDEFKKDECSELLKDKFDTFKVLEENIVVEILRKYLKKNLIDTYNKDLKDIKFYINHEFQIVLEYTINDKQLNLNQKVKRRKWNEIIESLSQFYTSSQLQEITYSMIESMFYVDEIEFQHLTNCIVKLVQDCPGSYNQDYNNQLSIYKSKYWCILGILPKSFNTFKRFGQCKILIIQKESKLFFLDHKKILESSLQQIDSQLFQAYTQLISDSTQRLETIKKEVSLKNNSISQNLLKLKNHTIELIENQRYVPEIENQLEHLKRIERQILSQLIDENDQEFFVIPQMQEDILFQANPVQEKYLQICNAYEEYRRVLNLIQEKVNNFKQSNKISEDKIKLKYYYRRVLQEQKRLIQQLPIYFKKLEIIKSIKQQQVILLIGATGSGKSTQLIQYLHEEIELKGKIICVQPRMIAAKSLARRVAEEMHQKVGGCVAYLNDFDQLEEHNKIIFTQDRILLNVIQNDPLLSEYDIVIVDEAHERNMNTDLLLGLLKDIMNKRKELKLIIMSATMDEQLFSDYFRCQVFKVEGKLHDVKIKYIDSYRDDYLNQICRLIYDKVILKIINQQYQQKHVLVFLAGVDEINQLLNQFKEYQDLPGILFLGLHGQMTNDEQYNAFEDTKKIKIIFSTRVAETSLTINDVSLVIDIGVDRFTQYDQNRGMQITKIDWISQAQANQRAGRAGRTRPGKCYRLYSLLEFQNQMQEHKIPEIQRICLDSVVLRIKSFDKDPFQFQFIQSPNFQSMKQSLEYLIDINALDEQGNITLLGKLMSQIQTEPRTSRILIEAFYRGVFNEVLSIICVMLNNKTLYLKTTEMSQKIDKIDEMGDFFTYKKIYTNFIELCNSGQKKQIKSICYERGYHYKTLKNCERVFEDMEKAFYQFSFQLLENQKLKNQIIKIQHSKTEDSIMQCFLSSFYPDLCVYNGNPVIGYTFIKSKKNIRIYGTCTLSLLNYFPKYIICSDLYFSNYFEFCRVAQEVKLDMLKQILKPDQIEAIENFVPNKYHYASLKNVSQSLLSHLLHTFTQYSYLEDEKKIQHYCNVDRDNGIFEIWSINPVDLDRYQQDYYEKMKYYLYFRLYGQSMLVYFKHGAEVQQSVPCTASELVIIQFATSPFPIEEIECILQESNLQYQHLFQINANQFGYSGQIFTVNQESALSIAKILNQRAEERLDQNENKRQGFQLFTIKPREIRNRIIRSSIELIFYGCFNKGFGFIHFEGDQDAEKFLQATFSYVKFNGQPQDMKLTKDNDQKQAIRISPIQIDANEYEFFNYLKNLAQQLQCPIPSRVNFIPNNQAETKDWKEDINKLFYKYVGEIPQHLDIHPDKNNYRIRVRVMTSAKPFLLEEMRKQINFTNGIIGTSSVYMKIEYKIIRLISKYILEQNKEEIEMVKKELSQKYQQDQLKVFSTGQNIIIIGNNPNLVRYASIMLHGVLIGYDIKINIKLSLFKQLLKNDKFVEDILLLEQENGFKYNKKLLFQNGKIRVYLSQDSLIKIQQAINQLIKESVSNSIIVNVRNYSFKPLLCIQNNLIFKLEKQFKVSIDFQIEQKRITIYGNNQQAQNCKIQLLNSLSNLPQTENENQCEICYSPVLEKYILALCNHYFCKNCLYEAIKSQNNPPYKCPSYNCGQTLSLQDLQNLLCEIEFSKILDQSFKKYKDKHADEYIGCITPDCDEFFLKLPSNQEQFYYCQSCLQSFCVKCKRNAHSKLSCEEAKKLYIEGKDLDEQELLKLNIKKCPKCQTGVQKNEGCLHVTCSLCHNHFCWVCLHQANNSDDIYQHLKEAHGGFYER